MHEKFQHFSEVSKFACKGFIVISEDFHFKVSDIEFNMNRPSYTIDTLAVLREKYDHDFRLIIGEDNLASFTKWKNHQIILDDFGLIVFCLRIFLQEQEREANTNAF